jgi:uncharacterized protein (DUF2164 family)
MNKLQTTTYRWNSGSTISRIEIEKMPTGKTEARLYANKETPETSLAALPRELHKYGFEKPYPEVIEGENCLIIPDTSNPAKLFSLLAQKGLVQGDAQVATDQNGKKKIDTLKYSGLVGMVGHGALMARGALRGDWNQVFQGPAGAAVPLILSAYGNGQDNIDFDHMLQEMHGYFQKEGIDLPPLESLEAKRSLIKTLNHFASTHSLELAGSIGLFGAYKGIRSGMNDRNWFRAGAGAVSGVGTAAMFLVPESKQDDDRSAGTKLKEELGKLAKACLTPTQLPGAMMDFVKAGPIMFMGVLNLADNALYGADIWKQITTFRKNQANPEKYEAEAKAARDKLAVLNAKPHSTVDSKIAREIRKLEGDARILEKELEMSVKSPLKGKMAIGMSVLTLLSWTAASTFAALSTKNATAEQQDYALEKLYAAIAKMIVVIPNDQRQDLLNKMANYLSTQPELKHAKMTSEKIVAQITKRIGAMEHSPWVARAQAQKADEVNAAILMS